MALRLRNQPNLKIVGILTAALALIAQPFAVLPFAEVFASSTLSLTPSQHTVAGSGDRNVGKRAESTVDAAGYTDLVLTFDHDARELDNNDFLHYGWQAPDGAEAQLGTINGANNSSNNPAPGEVGSKQYNLPAEAAVNGLKIWFENYTNNVKDDSVYLSNIALSGDEAAPVVQPTITSLRYATTTGPKTAYSGIVVDFVVSNFVDATDCVISIHRADGTDATRTCGPNLVNHINSSSSGANKSTTTPFSVLGSAPSSWYAETTGSWSQSTLPVSVTVVINTTSRGDITATNSNPLNQSYVPYADIAPADPEPFKINTPRYNVADGKVFAGGPETEVKLVWYPPTNSTNNRYEVRWAKSLEELATTDPVNTGQYPYKVIKDIENGQWFWQMRATKNGDYSDWATPRSFTVDIDKVGPTITNVKPVTGTSVKTDFTVSANVSDPNGVKKVALYVFDQATNTKVKEYPLSNTEGDIWTAQVKLADLRGDAVYDLRFRAADSFYNITYHNNRGGAYLVTVDRTSPTAVVNSPSDNAMVRGVVPVNITALDKNLEAYSYRIGNVATGKNVVEKTILSSTGVDGEAVYSWDTSAVEDGKYYVYASARDVVRNRQEYRIHVTVDNTAPTISVKDGFVGDKQAKIFSKVSFKLYDAGKVDKYTLNGVERDVSNNAWSDANYENIKGLLVEGENELVLYDVAGNTTSYKFTYDSTAPVGQFTYSNGGGNVLTKDDVTVTLTTDEAIATPEGWQKQTDTVFTRTFDSNGKRDVTVVDLAGNSTKLSLEVKRIDRNAPTISGVSNGAIVAGPAALNVFDPKYQGFDGFDPNHGLMVNGAKVSTQPIDGKKYLYTASDEGAYEVVATDKAGNSTSLMFTIDNTAPVVSLGSVKKEDGTVDVVASIADANLSHYWFTVTRDGVDVNLSNTKKHMYTEAFSDQVLATLSQPGEYVVKLEARDKAGNKDGTASKDGDSVKTISFTIVTPSQNEDDDAVDDGQTGPPETGGDDSSTEFGPASFTPRPNPADGINTGGNTYEGGDSAALGALSGSANSAILNPAVGTLFGGDMIARADDDDQRPDTARVLGEQDEQPAVVGTDTATATEADDEDGCWSFLGLCWYWWVLIVVALVTVAVLVRKAVSTNEADDVPGRRL